MSKSLISKFYPKDFYWMEEVEGYNEEEVSRLEQIYDISIKGDLRDFMMSMGKCSGGLFGDNNLIMIQDSLTPEGHVLFQKSLREDMPEEAPNHNIPGFCKDDGVFVFSRESDGCWFYFLRTRSDHPDMVYEFDEYSVTLTGETFLQHVRNLARESEHMFFRQKREKESGGPITLLWRGNMLPHED